MARDLPSAIAPEIALHHVSDHDPGLKREGAGPTLTYFDPEGVEVRDEATLARIRALAIPPAWTAVWISPDPLGHIQAVGRDARGRKQYRYHPAWRAARDEEKYERLAEFGAALPRLRRRIERDLAGPGLTRERVVAAAVRLLELTLIRVGNTEYARTNHSYGVTTLRKRHVTLVPAGAVFEFRGKSGVMRKTGFHDRALGRVLHRCGALPGQRLFQFLDDDGVRHSIESHDVNAYLHEAIGEGFSAKDFRTWAGTLAAAQILAGQPPPRTDSEAKRVWAACVKQVARELGNTPAVCRACYIHPLVFEAHREGRLSPDLASSGRPAELALLRLLRTAARV